MADFSANDCQNYINDLAERRRRVRMKLLGAQQPVQHPQMGPAAVAFPQQEAGLMLHGGREDGARSPLQQLLPPAADAAGGIENRLMFVGLPNGIQGLPGQPLLGIQQRRSPQGAQQPLSVMQLHAAAPINPAVAAAAANVRKHAVVDANEAAVAVAAGIGVLPLPVVHEEAAPVAAAQQDIGQQPGAAAQHVADVLQQCMAGLRSSALDFLAEGGATAHPALQHCAEEVRQSLAALGLGGGAAQGLAQEHAPGGLALQQGAAAGAAAYSATQQRLEGCRGLTRQQVGRELAGQLADDSDLVALDRSYLHNVERGQHSSGLRKFSVEALMAVAAEAAEPRAADGTALPPDSWPVEARRMHITPRGAGEAAALEVCAAVFPRLLVEGGGKMAGSVSVQLFTKQGALKAIEEEEQAAEHWRRLLQQLRATEGAQQHRRLLRSGLQITFD